MFTLDSSVHPRALRWRVVTVGLAVSAALMAGMSAQSLVDRYLYGPPEGQLTGFDSAVELSCSAFFMIINAPPVLFMFAVGAALSRVFGRTSAVLVAAVYAALLGALVLWWYLISGPISAFLARHLASRTGTSAPIGREL